MQNANLGQSDAEMMNRLRDDLLDSLDEEFEIELEDGELSADPGARPSDARRRYFRELFRLQGELVKLQDWVVATGHKMVIVFEGRDAAGKGGVIKRITQRLNPGCVGSRPCPLPMIASVRSGISSATWLTSLLRARSCCLTAAGTTAPVLKR